MIHKTYQRLELTYLAAFVVLGVCITFSLPPFQAPDEHVHFLSALQRTSRIQTFQEGEKFCGYPYALPQHFDLGRVAFHPDQKMKSGVFERYKRLEKVCIPDTPKVNYGNFFTYPGVTLSRLVLSRELSQRGRALTLFYLSRIFQGLLVALVLGRLVLLSIRSCRVVPGVLSTLGLCLSPVFVQQSFAVSADGVTLAASVSVLGLLFFRERLSKFDYVLAMALALITCSTKPPLFPLFAGISVACLMLETKWLQTAPSRRRQLYFISMLLGCFLGALWMFLGSVGLSLPADQVLGRLIDPGKQLLFMIENPVQTASTIFSTVNSYISFDTFTQKLGWMDAGLSGLTVDLWIVLVSVGIFADLVLLALAVHEKRKDLPNSGESDDIINGTHKWVRCAQTGLRKIISGDGLVALITLSGVYVACSSIVFALYLTWTQVGSAVVEGLQGRYFFPCAVLIPMALAGILISLFRVGKLEKPVENKHGNLCSACALAGVIVMISVYLSLVHRDLAVRYW